MTDDRFNKTVFAAWIGLAGSIALAVMKGIVGYLAGSKALIADALHTFSVIACSISILAGLRSSNLSADEDHSISSAKAESVTAIIISVFLLLAGIEVGISSVRSIYSGVDSSPGPAAFIAVVVSIILKEILVLFKYKAGKQPLTADLKASTWERKSDLLASITVFIGVGGAMLGNYLGNNLLYYLDPIAGIIIAVLICMMGYRIIKNVIHKKFTHAIHNEDSAELLRTVQMIKGVIAVDDLRARERGHYVIIDLKISVNPRISVLEGHDVAKIVKQTLMKRFIHISDVLIQVNPYDPGYPYKNNVGPEHDDHPSLLH